MTVEAVKFKLSSHCGTLASDMILHLKDGSGQLVAILTEPHRKLGFFSPEDGWVPLFQSLLAPCTHMSIILFHRITSLEEICMCVPRSAVLCRWVVHVIDTNPNSLSARGWLEDTSKVQKYVMSDAEYDARENTYRRHKAQKVKVPMTIPCSPHSLANLIDHAAPLALQLPEKYLTTGEEHMPMLRAVGTSKLVKLIGSLIFTAGRSGMDCREGAVYEERDSICGARPKGGGRG